MKDISFVRTEEEIKFIKKRNTNLNKIIWIPLSLDALIYLDLNNEEYINPLKYFTNLDHKKLTERCTHTGHARQAMGILRVIGYRTVLLLQCTSPSRLGW